MRGLWRRGLLSHPSPAHYLSILGAEKNPPGAPHQTPLERGLRGILNPRSLLTKRGLWHELGDFDLGPEFPDGLAVGLDSSLGQLAQIGMVSATAHHHQSRAALPHFLVYPPVPLGQTF